jgi:hypothetical protein
VQVVALYLVLNTYVYTWAIGSRTRLKSYRMCVYKEIEGDPEKTWTFYLDYQTGRCDPYVIHKVSDDRSNLRRGGR